jgi:anaerobic selenocysteine-containing dehydrogenase
MKCDLTVHVSIKLNRSHLTHGKASYILPCLGRTELDVQNGEAQFVTVENSTGVVHQSRGGKKPASDQLKSEPAIVAGLAEAVLGVKSSVPWLKWVENYDLVRDEISRTIPGFEDYNDRVRKPGGFYLPNGAREGKFKTSDAKAHFTVNDMPDISLNEDEFLMMTIRSHDQYNTTIYGLNDRYRGLKHERRVVLINPEDLQKFGWESGRKVDIVSNYDGIRREAKGFILVKYDIPQGCLGTYFPEANTIIPVNRFAHTSRTPISKSVVVKLEPV